MVVKMNMDELKRFMTFKRKGEVIIPISVIKVNENFILAIYKGKKSPADILIRYRQRLRNGNGQIYAHQNTYIGLLIF